MIPFDPTPGETPIDDLSGLLLREVRTRAQLNEAEAENILDAFAKYLGGKPDKELASFHLGWCYQLREEMFGRVWSWAGKRRNTNLNLGCPFHLIDTGFQTLLDNLHFWEERQSKPLVEQAAHLHHQAVAIHPFLNGNWRWSRLLANIWLARHDHPVVF